MRGFFFSLHSSSHSVLIFRRHTSFDFARLVHAMLSYREAWNEFFSYMPLGLLSGELLKVVLALRWDARLFRVLLVLLVSCHKGLCVLRPRTFLRLLSLTSSCGIQSALFCTCLVLLFVASHGVYGLLSIYSFFLWLISGPQICHHIQEHWVICLILFHLKI
jgi:hypothetical protein